MQINDMVMVYGNKKGNEGKLLLTRIDYVNNYLSNIYEDDQPGLAWSLWGLEETRKSRKNIQEDYVWGNNSLQARFCADRGQLREFLSETDEETGEWIPLDVAHCSDECIRLMHSYGLNEDGSNAHIRYKYEPTESQFEVGESLRNLNGSEYRIMETYSQSDLLLQNRQSGNFMVAIGTKMYARYPNMEGYSINDAIYGVEWEHGVYLNTSRPSEVDFAALREQYGQEGLYRETEAKYGYEKDGKEHSYEVEVAEIVQSTVTVDAGTLAEAVGKAEAMYEDDKIHLSSVTGVSIRPASWPSINLSLRATEAERQIKEEKIGSKNAEPASLPERESVSQPKSDLYLRDWEYAKKVGEAGDYMDSFRKNIRCKEALEDALRDGYVDGKLRYNIAAPLADEFGADRVHLVLVNSVGLLWSSGGISMENRDWARSEYRMMRDNYKDSFILRDDTNDFIIRPSAMPFCTAAVNAFTDQFRGFAEELELAANVQKTAVPVSDNILNASQKTSQQNKPKQRSPKL